MTSKLPSQYSWLAHETGPKILLEALRYHGVVEGVGEKNSPIILSWAKEIGGWIGSWYKKDSVPWCGLFMAICAKRANFPFNQKALSALEWAKWGRPRTYPMLGDVLVFKRTGGGHVGLYVGEDAACYHILGGNQLDSVCITRIQKSRLFAARHCAWRISEPENVRRIYLNPIGTVSVNEH